MGVLFLPAYVKALGAESYGLVGVYTVMQVWMAMLDLGLTPTLNREMARLRAGLHTPISIRDLLRSIEMFFLVGSMLLVTLIWFGAPAVADHWLQARSLPRAVMVESLRIMGFVLVSRWLEQIYRAALVGMQDQVAMNLIQGGAATLRWGGAFIVVIYVAPTIQAFFLWQGFASLATVLLLLARTYQGLPKATRTGRPNFSSLNEIRAFASGMFLTSVLSFLLTQADKILISKLLPMEQLGYYMLAASASGALLLIATPMNNAVYPRLTQMVALRDIPGLERTYRFSCELMSAILIPASLVLAFFARPVLMVWTGDAHMTAIVSPLLAVLSLGTMFNGLMNIPYQIQLAYGWTSLSVIVNAVAITLLLPAMYLSVINFGMIGAAWVWLCFNAISLIVTAHFMYSQILPDVKGYWYRYVVIAPLAAGALFGLVVSWLLPDFQMRTENFLELLFCGPLMLLVVLSTLPNMRGYVYERWRGRRA